jgi:hypothetical protein
MMIPRSSSGGFFLCLHPITVLCVVIALSWQAGEGKDALAGILINAG